MEGPIQIILVTYTPSPSCVAQGSCHLSLTLVSHDWTHLKAQDFWVLILHYYVHQLSLDPQNPFLGLPRHMVTIQAL